MPTPHHRKNLAVPGNRYTLREAASAGLMLSLRCSRCRRPATLFLATDLVRVLPPSLDCFKPPPFGCSRCNTDRYVSVTLRAVKASEVGKVTVRRLAGIRQMPVWRDELLGDSLLTRTAEEAGTEPPPATSPLRAGSG